MSKGTIPAYVLGVGLTQFLKPRRTREYPELGFEAGAKAMIDAKITFDDVETGVACMLTQHKADRPANQRTQVTATETPPLASVFSTSSA